MSNETQSEVDRLVAINTPRNAGWYDRREVRFYSYDDPLGIQLIGSGMEILQIMLAKGQHVNRQRDVLCKVLPYCFHELKNGDFLALGRDYKPLPMNARTFADYEAYTAFGIPREHLHFEWAEIHSQPRVYMFNDGSAPWLGLREARKYMTRLRGVMGAINLGWQS